MIKSKIRSISFFTFIPVLGINGENFGIDTGILNIFATFSYTKRKKMRIALFTLRENIYSHLKKPFINLLSTFLLTCPTAVYLIQTLHA